MNDELLRACTREIKALARLRVPEYELPSDSSLDRAVTRIAQLVAAECLRLVPTTPWRGDREDLCADIGAAIRQRFGLPPA